MARHNKTILVTAGPTREHIDPVRYISNLSSGTLGYAIAECAKRRGYDVVLITGPTHLPVPRGIQTVSITSAQELQKAVKKYFRTCDVLFMTSAVADYTPESFHRKKIKRQQGASIVLKATPDILQSIIPLKKKQIVCGFCLETHHLRTAALQKLQAKQLDMIVANTYGKSSNPFGANTMQPLIVERNGDSHTVMPQTKKEMARYLISFVEKKYLMCEK